MSAPPPTARAARQFIIFHVDGAAFAVQLSEVNEIIRVPGTAHLPLAPTVWRASPICAARSCLSSVRASFPRSRRVRMTRRPAAASSTMASPSASWSIGWPMSSPSRPIRSKGRKASRERFPRICSKT